MIIIIVVKNGENLLKIKGKDPCQYALKLLDELFPDMDYRNGRCYRRGPRTQEKPLLDEQRVQILDSKHNVIYILHRVDCHSFTIFQIVSNTDLALKPFQLVNLTLQKNLIKNVETLRRKLRRKILKLIVLFK